MSLDLVECLDRRLARRAVDLVAQELADGDTEVSVLLRPEVPGVLAQDPPRPHRRHSRTGASHLPHANVTTVPFHFTEIRDARRLAATDQLAAPAGADDGPRPEPTRLGWTRYRRRRSARSACDAALGVETPRLVRPLQDVPTLECLLEDGTGTLSVVFTGRRELQVARWATPSCGRNGCRAPRRRRPSQPRLRDRRLTGETRTSSWWAADGSEAS